MPIFDVTLSDPYEPEPVTATYFQVDDSFVIFKDDDHKQVAMFNARLVVCIRCTPRP